MVTLTLTLIAAFYAILAALPAETLPTFRKIAAIPVAITVALSLGLLGLVVDGRSAFIQLMHDARTLPREIRQLLREMRE